MSRNDAIVDDVTPSQRPMRSGTFSKEAREAADAFIAHKQAHPEPVPYDNLTPLQKRMRSEGA